MQVWRTALNHELILGTGYFYMHTTDHRLRRCFVGYLPEEFTFVSNCMRG
jgi:hypothetical protein